MKKDVNVSDYVSSVMQEKINWLTDVHDKYPPKCLLATVSLFYSKMNDNYESFVERVFDDARGNNEVIYDFVRNIYVFLYNLWLLLRGSSVGNKIDRSKIRRNVIIDYLNVHGDKRVGVPDVFGGDDTDCIVFNQNSGIAYDLRTSYSLLDVVRFAQVLLYLSFSVPIVKGEILESFVEKSRELTNFYLFEIYLVSRFLENGSGRIIMLYEDQPRDRLLLYYLSKRYEVIGYYHTPALHWYRYNLLDNGYGYDRPDFYICKYLCKKNMLVNFKGINPDLISVEDHRVVKSDLLERSFSTLIVYLPNNDSIVREYCDVFEGCLEEIGLEVCIAPHPSTDKKIIGETMLQFAHGDPSRDDALVISSYMTNKGYYMMEKGYSVLYIGSDVLPYYNPFPGLVVPFLSSPKDLVDYLQSLIVDL